MTHQQLIHKWAGGHAGQASNLRSDGESIYYYGTWMGTRRSADEFVLNDAKFRPLTGKVQSFIRRNTSGTRHLVPNPANWCQSWPDPVTLAANLRSAVKVQARRTSAQINRERYAWDRWETLRAAGFLTEPAPAEWEHAEHFTDEAIVARIAKEDARRAAREAENLKRDARIIARDAARLEYWVSTTECPTSHFHYSLPTRLRITGDTLETSRGATVPLAIARRAYRKWMAGKNVTGTNVGGFAITSVDDTSAVIGCHTIAVEELHRVLGNS